MDEDEFYEPLNMPARLTVVGVLGVAVMGGLLSIMLIGLGL